MPVKRASRQGSNSIAAKLISKANNFGINSNINNNYDEDEFNDIEHHQNGNNYHNSFDDDDEVFVLTAKQKQQIQRNEFLESLTKEQLKSEAKRRGQKTSGTKSELVLICNHLFSHSNVFPFSDLRFIYFYFLF